MDEMFVSLSEVAPSAFPLLSSLLCAAGCVFPVKYPRVLVRLGASRFPGQIKWKKF